MADELGTPESSGTFILPILERMDEVTQRQVDNDVKLEKTLSSLLKFLEGYGGDGKGGRGGGQPPERNPLQPKTPSNLMNVFSWMGEKKDKTLDFIKKGFFKLFKTDYFGNLFKAINNLAKALTNSFMSWLKFFLMMAFIDPSGGFLRDIINLFTEIGMMLFKIIMPLIPVAVKMMFDTIVYVFKLVLRLMPEIISTIMQTFTQLGNTFPILKPIIFFINQFLSAIRSLFVILNDPKADKGKGFQNFLSKVFKILGNVVEKVLEFVVEKAPIVFNFLLDFISNTVIPALVKYVPKILDAFSEGIDVLIKKYPNLKVWIQPIKDIFDMLSAYIGSFAKFNSGEFIQSLDTYKKKEEQLFKQRDYQNANEEKRMKMLSDMQYGFIVDNKAIVEKAQQDFNKMNEDKLNLAKTKWDEFLTHIMETIGKAYDSTPTSAKVGIWTYFFLTISAWLISIGTWFVTNKVVLIAIVAFFKSIAVAIATFFGVTVGTVAVIAGVIVAVIALVGLIWYFWDDIKKFFSDMWDYISKWFSDTWKSISDWYEKLDIMTPLKNIGLMIIDVFDSIIDILYDVFVAPALDIADDFINFFKNIKLPDWMTSWMNGMGGGTDASELQNSRKPTNANTFEELQKKRNEAEKNYLKSSQFFIDKKTEERLKLRAMDNNNLFGDYGKTFTDSLKKEIDKNPVTANIKVDASNATITKLPSITPTIDMTSAIKSATNFEMIVSNIFSYLSRWARKAFQHIPKSGITVTKFEEDIDYSKYTREQQFQAKKFFSTIEDNKELGDLYERALGGGFSSLAEIKKALGDKATDQQLVEAFSFTINELAKNRMSGKTTDVNTIILNYSPIRQIGKS